MPAMLSARNAGRFARRASPHGRPPPRCLPNRARHGRPSAGSWRSDARRGRAVLPLRSTMPARALPVPTSTAQTMSHQTPVTAVPASRSGNSRMSAKIRSGRRVASSATSAAWPACDAAGEGEDAHARAVRGVDAGRAVLDDDAVGGGHAHLARRVQEQVRRRLASPHHGGTVQMRLEHFQQAGEAKRQPDAVQAAGRGDAARNAKPRKRLRHARHRLQLARETAASGRRASRSRCCVAEVEAEFLAQHLAHARPCSCRGNSW